MKSFLVGIKIIFTAVCALAFLIPINVLAQTPFYVAIKPGVYFPQYSGLDTGLSGEVAFGYRFNPNLAAEFGLGFFNTKGEVTVPGSTNAVQDFHINVYPATFTLKAILPYKKWEFFGLGGGGVYLVFRPYNYEDYDHHHHYDYDYDVIFGGYLGAGIQYNITPRIFAGIEGKYLWTDKVKYRYGDTGAPLEAEFRLDGITSTLLVGFRF